MLKWKPASTREAVLKMQHAIRQYPNTVDFKQCHYYVTDLEIARELGKDVDALTKVDVDSTLEGLGLKLDKEVYDMTLESENSIGYFVPASALLRVGIELPAWDIGQSFTTRSGARGSRTQGKKSR
jgi:hypothetical protein